MSLPISFQKISINSDYTVSFAFSIQLILADTSLGNIIITLPDAPASDYYVSIYMTGSNTVTVNLVSGGTYILFADNPFRQQVFSTELQTWIPLQLPNNGLKPYLYLAPVKGFDRIVFPTPLPIVDQMTVSFYDPLLQMEFLPDYSTYTFVAGNPTFFYTDNPNVFNLALNVSVTLRDLVTDFPILNQLNGIQTMQYVGIGLLLDFDSSAFAPLIKPCKIYNNDSRIYIPFQTKCLDNINYILS